MGFGGGRGGGTKEKSRKDGLVDTYGYGHGHVPCVYVSLCWVLGWMA